MSHYIIRVKVIIFLDILYVLDIQGVPEYNVRIKYLHSCNGNKKIKFHNFINMAKNCCSNTIEAIETIYCKVIYLYFYPQATLPPLNE